MTTEIALNWPIIGKNINVLRNFSWYVQDVANDADTPRVRLRNNAVIVDNFRGDELGRSEQHLRLLLGVVGSRQTEIDEFDLVTVGK